MENGNVLNGDVLSSPRSAELRFVDYLRGSVRWAGFPALAFAGIEERELAPLMEGLEPF